MLDDTYSSTGRWPGHLSILMCCSEVQRNHDPHNYTQSFVRFSPLQHLTRDESPSPTAEELEILEDEESPLDDWVELQVSGESSPPLEDNDQDLESPTILWVGPALETVGSDELQEQFPSASSSSGPTALEGSSDTEVIESDVEEVLHSCSVPSSKQTPASLEGTQFVPQVAPPNDEEETLVNQLELPVGFATPVVSYSPVNEGTTVSQALEPEPESVQVENQDVTITEQSLTLVEEAEANLSPDLLQDRKKISKDLPGTTASEELCTVSATTTATHEETEKGKGEPDQDTCSSFQVLHPIEEPTSVQGTLEKCC